MHSFYSLIDLRNQFYIAGTYTIDSETEASICYMADVLAKNTSIVRIGDLNNIVI